MGDQQHNEGASTSESFGGISESIVELNVKTLDSQIYTFQVDKNVPVSLFKEKIAGKIGLPVGQQRLIFRGKVLKDDHLLSEYHVESGDTLHLVARQPSESGANSGESNATTTNRGQDASGGGPRSRVGPISHSVVLGTLNVGDPGEGIVPDISRVIGAVLNSFGVGSQTTTNGIGIPQLFMQAPLGNETEGTQSNAGGQNQAGNQAQPGQTFPSQPSPQVVQIPLGAAISVPSLNVPIPDSLSTILEFMSRMEQALSQNGYQSNQTPTDGDVPTTINLPSNSRGFPTPESLTIILQHAQRLLGGHAIAALSHVAGRLEQEGGSADPNVRSQIQTESMQVGIAMQHLGALFLELGRVMLTLRMGQSPAESYVNAGPAVYVSPTGPNPIMVQPFPLQTSSLFGGPGTNSLNPGTSLPVGIGNIPRHVNIHIHTAVGARATNGEGIQGDRHNGPGGDLSQTRAVPMRNVVAAAFPSHSPVSVSNASQSADSVPQAPPESIPLPTVVTEVNSRIRNLVDNMLSENQASSGQSDSSNTQDLPAGHGAIGEGSNSQEVGGVLNLKEGTSSSGETILTSRSSHGNDNPESTPSAPLGLGLGGLQPKRRTRQPKSQATSSDDGTSSSAASNRNQQTRSSGQQVLQSLASLANRTNASSGQLTPALGRNVENVPLGVQGAGGQFDVTSAMSQVLQSPALNGLLAGVSEQTGVGSPNVLRNMLEQLTQNPAMRNTVNQIAQQVDTQDLGHMFSGLGGSQGGGFDLSRMMQQMMPIVSQALSGGPNVHQPMATVGSEGLNNQRSSRDVNTSNPQIDLHEVSQRLQHQNPPEEIFRSMVESAARLYGNGTGVEDLVDELCQEEGLTNDFMQTLRSDVSRRLQDES